MCCFLLTAFGLGRPHHTRFLQEPPHIKLHLDNYIVLLGLGLGVAKLQPLLHMVLEEYVGVIASELLASLQSATE